MQRSLSLSPGGPAAFSPSIILGNFTLHQFSFSLRVSLFGQSSLECWSPYHPLDHSNAPALFPPQWNATGLGSHTHGLTFPCSCFFNSWILHVLIFLCEWDWCRVSSERAEILMSRYKLYTNSIRRIEDCSLKLFEWRRLLKGWLFSFSFFFKDSVIGEI